jgi:hypothetical protein
MWRISGLRAPTRLRPASAIPRVSRPSPSGNSRASAIVAKRSSAGRGAGDCLVAKAIAARRTDGEEKRSWEDVWASRSRRSLLLSGRSSGSTAGGMAAPSRMEQSVEVAVGPSQLVPSGGAISDGAGYRTPKKSSRAIRRWARGGTRAATGRRLSIGLKPCDRWVTSFAATAWPRSSCRDPRRGCKPSGTGCRSRRP